jgi:hypothetical protein
MICFDAQTPDIRRRLHGGRVEASLRDQSSTFDMGTPYDSWRMGQPQDLTDRYAGDQVGLASGLRCFRERAEPLSVLVLLPPWCARASPRACPLAHGTGSLALLVTSCLPSRPSRRQAVSGALGRAASGALGRAASVAVGLGRAAWGRPPLA